jgi:hypothetical protein
MKLQGIIKTYPHCLEFHRIRLVLGAEVYLRIQFIIMGVKHGHGTHVRASPNVFIVYQIL